MTFSKVRSLLMERRWPWFITHRLELARNGYYFYRNRLANCLVPQSSGLDCNEINSTESAIGDKKKTVLFMCGFHGQSGGMYAIANIANMLADKYDVQFVSHPQSFYNSHLASAVNVVNKPHTNADVFICDVTCEHGFIEAVQQCGRPCLVTCHGLLDKLHGLNPGYVRKSLDLADKVHFVNEVQQHSFHLPEGKYEIIPNTNKPIKKTKNSRAVGTVGNLSEVRKNA